ncbi:MAG: YDG domain-containing protein [Christensenellales bacterium]
MVCKKISGRLCLLLAVLLLLCAWLPLGVAHAEEQSDPAIDTSWYKADSVFFSLEDRADFLGFLSLISQGVTFQNQSLQLINDIDLQGAVLPAAGVFSGFLDGKGHALVHFSQTGARPALFDTLTSTATVQNLTFSDVSLQGNAQAAALAVLAQSGATIHNCTVSGGSVSAPVAGGLVVHLLGNASLSHCENSAQVSAEKIAGGLAAQSIAEQSETAQLTACINRGKVSAGQTAGGLVGTAQQIAFTHGLNFADVSLVGTQGEAGGLVGSATLTAMEGCTNSGAVSASAKSSAKVLLGGLAGSAGGAISNVCNTGSIKSVSTHSQSASGGLFGAFTTGAVEKARNQGSVAGQANTGGLFGTANFVPQEADAFYQLENQGAVSGQANTGGLFGCLALSADSQTRSISRVLAQGANFGSVNGTRSVGGLVGQFTLADRTATAQSLMADSMNLGQIEGESQVGGLVGTLPRIRCAENTALIQTSYHKGNVLAKTSVGTMAGVMQAEGAVFDHCASPAGKQMTGAGAVDGVTELSEDEFRSDALLTLLNSGRSVWSFSDNGEAIFAFITELLAPSASVKDEAVVKHTYPLVLSSTAGAEITYRITMTADDKPETSDPQTLYSGESLSLAAYAPGTELVIEATAKAADGTQSEPATLHLQIQAVQPLTITGLSLSAASREYDGTTTIALQGTPSLMGAITEGDDIHVDGAPYGRFLDKDAGTGKVVSVQGISLVGADAEYYTLITPIFTADIVRRPLTLQNVAIADKGYDGTAAANVSNIDLVGVLEGESVSVDYLNAKAAFISPDRGENVAAFVTNLQLQGADSHNYSLLETTAMASGRIVTMPSIDRVNTAQSGQCTLSLDGLESVMPSMLSPGENGTVQLYAVANDIPLPEKAQTAKDDLTQSLMAVDLQLKQAYVQDGVRQSESTLPPGMVTSPLTVHFTFATNDKKQAFQICQMDASGDLIALETQTQNNSDDTVTLTAQTQSMGTFVIQGTKQDTSSEASFATVLPYVLLLIIVLLIIFAGRRTKGSKG